MQTLQSDRPARPLLRRALPLSLAAVCFWLLWQEAATLDLPAVATSLGEIPAWRWVAAGLATLASFRVLAEYDLVGHRHMGTGLDPRRARRAGAASIAIAQVTGAGPAVGAAVRWRLLPVLGRGGVLALTALVGLSFIASWALLAVAVALPVVFGLAWLAPLLLALALPAVGYGLWRVPEIRLLGRTLRLPSLQAAGRMIALAALDLIFAGLALWLLMPVGTVAPFTLIAAYTLALGGGLMLGTPGGVGPFELGLALLLPAVGAETLAAALIGYRLIYYAVPCVIAALYAALARPLVVTAVPTPRHAPARGPRAEHAFVAQSDSRLLASGPHSAALLTTAQTMTLFLGAQTGRLGPLLAGLRATARGENRIACLYKITGRDAVAARRAGWSVVPVAREAVLDPRDFTLDTPERRQLRRALRKAAKDGITTRRLTAPDWIEMSGINTRWAAAHGGERGLSMGRFCPAFLSDKPIFAAYKDGHMVAFITCVTAPGVMSLDIMRHEDGVPAGTIQALIVAAVEAAGREGCHEFNLAALPDARLMRFTPGAEGLERFKTAFAPRWRKLYIAAPDMLSLAIAAADLWRTIQQPGALRQPLTTGIWESAAPTVPAPANATLPPARRWRALPRRAGGRMAG